MQGKGWYNESLRHSLARQGIKTGGMVTDIQNTIPLIEAYPPEYNELNNVNGNPLFDNNIETKPRESLISFPEFETDKSKVEVASEFNKKLLDF